MHDPNPSTAARTRQVSAPFVEIADGHRLFVRDWGTGKPVVLLAGWAMDSRLWGGTMAALNDAGLRTVAYDRRGHGRSTDPGRIDYDLLADDLKAVLDALDLTDVTLVAHSGASGEAIRYVSRHGAGRIARIVLIGATGPRMMAPGGVTAEMLAATTAQLRDDPFAWVEANGRPFAPQADARTIDWLGMMVVDTSRRIMIDFQHVIAEADLTAEAAALTVPVTILHGELDVSAPIDLTARRYAMIIPDVDMIVYEGVAHGPMVTDPARLAADIVARARMGRTCRLVAA